MRIIASYFIAAIILLVPINTGRKLSNTRNRSCHGRFEKIKEDKANSDQPKTL